MDTIDNNVMQAAAEDVIWVNQTGVEVHTVTITLSGQHGGADVVIDGFVNGDVNDPAHIEKMVL